jgi:hypothetical protein
MIDFDTLQFASRERKREKSSVRFYREEKVKKTSYSSGEGKIMRGGREDVFLCSFKTQMMRSMTTGMIVCDRSGVKSFNQI